MGRGPVLVDDADPLDAADRVAVARAQHRVPVVVGPGWPPEVAAPLLAAAAGVTGDRLVVLTSGSSAAPRAVLRTWESWRASFEAFDVVTGLGPDDLLWVPGTAASTLTLFAVLHARERGLPLRTGGRWRGLAPSTGPGTDVDSDRAAELARVTAVHAVPAVVAEVLHAAGRGVLPGLRLVVTAGAQVPVTLRETADRLGVALVEYYGAAELSFVAADADGSGLEAFPGVELEVRDGVVWARSPYLSQGYLAGPAGDVTGPFRLDGEGWATVGDRGTLHGDRLVVHGRPGSTVSVGATTVLLDDVEAVLRAVPGVAELVCGGEPDPRLGERLVAVVQPLPGADPQTALKQAARRLLPPPSRPVRWVLEPVLPTTPAGKVDRRRIRDALRARA
jgi:acyl-CoA synthetase (AMP-forming)/AMP-acid ligase II